MWNENPSPYLKETAHSAYHTSEHSVADKKLRRLRFKVTKTKGPLQFTITWTVGVNTRYA